MQHSNQLTVCVLEEHITRQDVSDHESGACEFETPIRDGLVALLRPTLENKGLGTYSHKAFVSGRPDVFYASIIFEAKPANFNAALNTIRDATRGTAFEGTFRCFMELTEMEDDAPPYKSIEIYYSIADIPPGYEHPLEFRNEAMHVAEAALEAANAGEWTGAEIGMGVVNFGFEVKNFEKAEAIVRTALQGTPFDCIREITRYEGP